MFERMEENKTLQIKKKWRTSVRGAEMAVEDFSDKSVSGT